MVQPLYRLDVPTTFVTDDRGFLVDAFELEFELLDMTAPAAPVVIGARTAATRISLGYYAATGVADDAAFPSGTTSARRAVRWYLVREDGDDEIVFSTSWERLTSRIALAMPSYCLVSDLRDEGFTSTQLSDVRAQILIARASKMIEAYTGRVFAPVPRALTLDGRGGSIVQFGEPVIAISEIVVTVEPRTLTTRPIDEELVRVYSRHLTQRLHVPDDRENPKIELYAPKDFRIPYGATDVAFYTWERLTWPVGSQNVRVTGVWGYTDPDGSPMGRTPDLIRHVCMLLVKREIAQIASADRDDAAMARRVVSERTREQAVTYASLSSSSRSGTPLLGAFTGDPEIDTILAMYVRPPGLAAV